MSFDSNDERAETPGADDGARGGDAARPGRGARPERRRDVALVAHEEVLLLGETDVEQARSALAQLGAQGSRSLDELSVVDSIALLKGLQKLSGAVAAVQARALVHLEHAVAQECRDQGETAKQALKVARAEAAAALKNSTSASGQSMSSCRRLVQSMPGMLAALAHGRIVPASAHQIGRTMSPASPGLRSRVDEILTAHLGHLEDCGAQQWGDEAERVLHGLDPAGAAARHQVATRERNVSVRRGRHGMATVTAHVTGLDAALIRKGLSLAAESARAHGDRRGHQQIMADLFADTLLGRGEGMDPSTLEIGVLVTDRSLLAPHHADAATIEGFGSVPYDHIRDAMLRSLETAESGEDPELEVTLRKVFLDHDDGQVVAVESRSRKFPPALARMIRYADQTCRAPHCDAPIRQIDHITPWAQGGETSFANGNGLCAADNQKEDAGQRASVVADRSGKRRSVEWTTRYGQKARRGGVNFDPVGTAQRQRRDSALYEAAKAELTRRELLRHLAERRVETDQVYAPQSGTSRPGTAPAGIAPAGIAPAHSAPADTTRAFALAIDEIGASFERNFAKLDLDHEMLEAGYRSRWIRLEGHPLDGN